LTMLIADCIPARAVNGSMGIIFSQPFATQGILPFGCKHRLSMPT